MHQRCCQIVADPALFFFTNFSTLLPAARFFSPFRAYIRTIEERRVRGARVVERGFLKVVRRRCRRLPCRRIRPGMKEQKMDGPVGLSNASMPPLSPFPKTRRSDRYSPLLVRLFLLLRLASSFLFVLIIIFCSSSFSSFLQRTPFFIFFSSLFRLWPFQTQTPEK